MSTKLRLAAVLGLAAILGACTTPTADLGSGAPASAGVPLAIASLNAPALNPSAAPTPAPSAAASAGPSAGPSDGGSPLPPISIDPCSLMTQADAVGLIHKPVGAGVSSLADPERVCTFQDGALTKVKLFLAPQAPSAAIAQGYWDAERAQVPAGIKVDDITIPGLDRASYVGGQDGPLSLSGLFALKGTTFFEVFCENPLCTEVDSAAVASQVTGELP
jgi:hypothetical protein